MQLVAPKYNLGLSQPLRDPWAANLAALASQFDFSSALQDLGWVEEMSTEDFDGVCIHGQVRLLATRVEHAAEASQTRCDESILESAAVVPCTVGPGNIPSCRGSLLQRLSNFFVKSKLNHAIINYLFIKTTGTE